MKTKWMMLVITFVMIIIYSTSVAASDSTVKVYVGAYDIYTHEKSRYSYPDMREDDFFVVEKVEISNLNKSEKNTLLIKLLDSSNIEKQRCWMNIPEIEAGETKEIPLTTKEGYGNWTHTCYLSLDKIGGWTLSPDFTNNLESRNLMVISEGKPYSFNFKVTSKYVLEALELNEKAIDVSWKGAIIGGVIGAIIGFSLSEFKEFLRRRRIRKNVIKSLIYELNRNKEFAKRLVDQKEFYLKGNILMFDEFIMLNLEEALKRNYLENNELRNELLEYFDFFKTMNNFIFGMRYHPRGYNGLEKVIKNIESGDIINKMENLIIKLDSAI